MEVVELRPGWAVKAIMIIIIASILLRCVSAANLTVGGTSGWDLASNVRAWASTTTFHVGDTLVFSYTPVHDVLEVTRGDYATCITVNPIRVFTEGETTVPLTEAGTRYFICGRRGHCGMGLKLRVDVLPQSSSNETGHPRRPPVHHTHHPPPPSVHPPSPPPVHPPSPSPPSHVVPSLPDTPPVDAPPPPPASPCERFNTGVMLTLHHCSCWLATIFSILIIMMI